DRFVSSTLAYQGAAGGMPMLDILDVARVAMQGITPDLVIVFDVDEPTAQRRMSPLLDRMEAKGGDFHRKVREGYLKQVAADPDHRQRPADHPAVLPLIDERGGPERLVPECQRDRIACVRQAHEAVEEVARHGVPLLAADRALGLAQTVSEAPQSGFLGRDRA